MSLDVYLTLPGKSVAGSGIFVREAGSTREISRAEWDQRFPGAEPIVCTPDEESSEVYWRNITHNLNRMAKEAGIYEHLWCPDEIGVTKAEQLVAPLAAGLALLESDPQRFEKLNPENGWGSYAGLVEFVRDYLDACREYPHADVYASR